MIIRSILRCRSGRGLLFDASHHLLTARRLPTITLRMKSSFLPPVEPLLSSVLSSDSYQLLPNSHKAGDAEDALFEAQVEEINKWWSSARYDGIRRPYSAEDVVSKRGALQQTYPSSLMARKLFNLFRDRAKIGEPVHTSASVVGDCSIPDCD